MFCFAKYYTKGVSIRTRVFYVKDLSIVSDLRTPILNQGVAPLWKQAPMQISETKIFQGFYEVKYGLKHYLSNFGYKT